MKLNLLVLILLIAFTTSKIFSQSGVNDIGSLKKLELTSSPAYILLGIQPTNITRPSTPRDFSVGIQSANVNGVLQPGFAMEANPFVWGQDQSKNSFKSLGYFDNNIFNSMLKNFSISLATSATDTTIFGELEKGTGLGFGFRTTVVPGTINRKVLDLYLSWAKSNILVEFLNNVKFQVSRLPSNSKIPPQVFLDSERSAIQFMKTWDDIPDYIKKEVNKEVLGYSNNFFRTYTKEELLQIVDLEIESLINSYGKDADAIKDVKELPFAREGFILELAYSGVYHLQNNVWDNAVYAKSGLWLTPSYRLDFSKKNSKGCPVFQSIDFLGIARYLWNDELVDKSNFFDAGFKLQYNREKLSASLEGIYRYASTLPEGVISNWTNSWIANVNYLITEDISVRFSFGSKFNGNTKTFDQPQGLLVMGGLNFDIPGLSK
jgi:hypothetical protein